MVEIAARLEEAGFETWCVGGAVRDAFLGGGRDDVDLATAATPDQVQSLFRRTVPVGLRFGTVGVLDGNRQLHEVTTFRRDVTTDGRHAVVAFGATLEEDLARRDFTINAIAYHPLRHEIRDPYQGEQDLASRTIRAVGEAEERFREDYLRILRAVRFATRLDFAIAPDTWAAAKRVAGGMARLSAERVRDEWYRTLETARSVARVMDLWREIGAADQWLAGLVERYPFAADPPPNRDPVLVTMIASRDGMAALEALKASNQEIDRARRIATAAAAPAPDPVRLVRRWLAAVEPAADDLAAVHRLRTGEDPGWLPAVRGIRDRGEPLSRADLAITGDDLRQAGIPAGPQLGRILGALLDAVLDDPSLNRRDLLLERARAS